MKEEGWQGRLLPTEQLPAPSPATTQLSVIPCQLHPVGCERKSYFWDQTLKTQGMNPLLFIAARATQMPWGGRTTNRIQLEPRIPKEQVGDIWLLQPECVKSLRSESLILSCGL